MEFLKNHYEKIILSLTLALVTAGAVWLALQSVQVRTEIEGLGQMAAPQVRVDTNSVTNVFLTALTNGRAPQQVDFDGADHKIFNAEKILERTLDKVKYPADKLGPKSLEIKEIRSLPLTIRVEQRTVRSRTSVYAYMRPAYEQGRYAVEKKTSIREGKAVRFGRTYTLQRQIVVNVEKINVDPENPDTLSVDFTFSMLGGAPEQFTVKAKETWTRDLDFEADLYYPPEQRDFLKTRVGHIFTFGGDTNQVIQINEEGFTVRAFSNQKRVTVTMKNPVAAIAPAAVQQKPAATAPSAMSTGAPGAGVVPATANRQTPPVAANQKPTP
ncbi:MAG: hypothetical protein CMO80_15445 [Verrucomicrobiales bacterium]|nr:hypothetical protein [Verrucomicrobiales bacterium]